jgi:hypothetical protein
MKIKMLTGLVTERSVKRPGDVIDMPKADAIRMIKAKFAIPYRGDCPETAVTEPAETR